MKKNFYEIFETFKGKGFEEQCKKTLTKTKILAVVGIVFFVIGFVQIKFSPWVILIVFGAILITISAILNGSLTERIKAWPYIDKVINWDKVKQKKEEERENHNPKAD